MSLLTRYRALYEHEKDSNLRMLAMLESVPEAHRSDARFQQAVTHTGHPEACRENWLDHMDREGRNQVAWWDEQCELATLRPRFAAPESQWTDYLARLEEDRLAEEFEFSESDGERFRLPIEVQIVQMNGHASYHRGQVALLVDQLGGETVDTDYADWWWTNREKSGEVKNG
jgi:uncharacterized damage-inducible protein DinB